MMQKIKIIFIIPTLDMGGAERLLVDIIKNLNPEKFLVKIICLKRFGVWGFELKDRGIPLILLGQKYGLDFIALFKLIKILRRERPDIVHTHLFGADIYGSLAARLAAVKYLVSTEHNLNFSEGLTKRIAKRFTGRLFNNIIAVSVAVKKYVSQTYYIKAEKIIVIHNGVEINKFLIPIKLGREALTKEKIVIGSIGRLGKQKGFEYLIEAVAKLSAGKFECLIASTGELKAQLEEKADKLGLENKIIFLGRQDDIKQFLNKIDIFVLPSLWEGFGIAILEAGLAGRPVIASRVDGIREIIDDHKDGLLVKPADSTDLAEKIEYLTEHRKLAAELALSLQTKIKNNFSIGKIAVEYENLYLKLYYYENFTDK